MYTLYSQVLRKVNKCEISEHVKWMVSILLNSPTMICVNLPRIEMLHLVDAKAKTGTGFWFLVFGFVLLFFFFFLTNEEGKDIAS